jgi:saposin
LLITTGTWAYSSDCAKGPEYWCRDVSTAEDCGAVRHCQQTIWRENEINKKPMTNSETAQMLCNVLVQASKELLADGSMNFNSIKQSLRQDCIQLPHQNQLIQKVNEYN